MDGDVAKMEGVCASHPVRLLHVGGRKWIVASCWIGLDVWKPTLDTVSVAALGNQCCHAGHSWRFKQDSEWNFPVECRPELLDQSRSQQRVTTQSEEITLHTYLWQRQHAPPHRCDPHLQGISWRDIVIRSVVCVRWQSGTV